MNATCGEKLGEKKRKGKRTIHAPFLSFGRRKREKMRVCVCV
jgi:hypothetical protein